MCKVRKSIVPVLLVIVLLLSGCGLLEAEMPPESPHGTEQVQGTGGATSVTSDELTDQDADSVTLADIPEYSGSPYVQINDGVPFFTDADMTETSFETYSELDTLGRCGMAWASVGTDIMPTEERGNIGSVHPSGWQTVKYKGVVEGSYLYNRCHLIGYQLTGENTNEKNLITGTRYFNVDGMLPFENMVADYVKETNNHVMYRVTPFFEGENLVADGVLMEGKSVEDDGEGIEFNVFVYNIQPGIKIDYATGESSLAEETDPKQADDETYILNTNTKKFHYTTCASAEQLEESNKEEYTGTRDELIAMGYSPCGRCHP